MCACACVRVCVITCAWMCGCVKLHTSILYNTASAICHRGELTHELNRDMEQIYLKQLRYILWTTVKHPFFIESKKMNLGLTYIYIWNYIYMHHAETERNHDGHLTFYLLLSGFRNNQNSCFNFLTSCPMYLFVPRPPTPHTPPPPAPCPRPPPTPLPPPPTPRWTVFGTVDLEQSEGSETPRGFT